MSAYVMGLVLLFLAVDLAGAKHQDAAAKFGVSRQTVSQVVNGKRWAEATASVRAVLGPTRVGRPKGRA